MYLHDPLSLRVRVQLVLRVILPRRDGERGASGPAAPALPSPELEVSPASPLPSLLIPAVLPLVLLPISETAFPPRTWFTAPSYRM